MKAGTKLFFGQCCDVLTCQEENRCILDVCGADLSQREKENLLLFFNHSWKKPMEGNTIVHWCGPGCCTTASHCQERFKEAVDIALGSFPDIPLLYRWKAFEPAANYALRGCLLHQIWPHLLGAAVRDVDEKEKKHAQESLADDSADATPAVRQQVRLLKTAKLFREDGADATCLHCVKLYNLTIARWSNVQPLSLFSLIMMSV